jgi:hypothetical protein
MMTRLIRSGHSSLESHPDNVIYDITANPYGGTGISAGGFGHPTCINTGDQSKLPPVQWPRVRESWAADPPLVRRPRTRTGLCRHSNRSLFASRISAGKGFREGRDSVGIFGDIGQFWVTETAPSRVSGGKATESYRLFLTAPGNRNCAGLCGGGRTPPRPLQPRIPCLTREINREFFDFGPLLGDSRF